MVVLQETPSQITICISWTFGGFERNPISPFLHSPSLPIYNLHLPISRELKTSIRNWIIPRQSLASPSTIIHLQIKEYDELSLTRSDALIDDTEHLKPYPTRKALYLIVEHNNMIRLSYLWFNFAYIDVSRCNTYAQTTPKNHVFGTKPPTMKVSKP